MVGGLENQWQEGSEWLGLLGGRILMISGWYVLFFSRRRVVKTMTIKEAKKKTNPNRADDTEGSIDEDAPMFSPIRAPMSSMMIGSM